MEYWILFRSAWTSPLRVPSSPTSLRQNSRSHLQPYNHPRTTSDPPYDVLPKRGRCLLSYGDDKDKDKEKVKDKDKNAEKTHHMLYF